LGRGLNVDVPIVSDLIVAWDAILQSSVWGRYGATLTSARHELLHFEARLRTR
jgi:hypothetical protein